MIPAEIICSWAHEKHAGASCWLQKPWHKGAGAPAAGVHQGELEFVPDVGSVKLGALRSSLAAARPGHGSQKLGSRVAVLMDQQASRGYLTEKEVELLISMSVCLEKISRVQVPASSLTFFHLRVKLGEQCREGRKEDIFIQLMKQTQSGNNEVLFLRIKANYVAIQSS